MTSCYALSVSCFLSFCPSLSLSPSNDRAAVQLIKRSDRQALAVRKLALVFWSDRFTVLTPHSPPSAVGRLFLFVGARKVNRRSLSKLEEASFYF